MPAARGWRFAMLGGAACGLAAAPSAEGSPPSPGLAAAALAGLVLLALARPRRSSWIWLGGLGLAAALLGLALGGARVAAIDAGALDLPRGSEVTLRGFVTAVPRRSDGEISVSVETRAGRFMARAREPVAELGPGDAVRVEGTVTDPPLWQAPWLQRLGVRDLVLAREIDRVGGRRGGLSGWLDRVRGRAEAALGHGTGAEAAALLRGFVLGQDDRIEEPVVDDFKRSGLAHLLAVSGQNVILLAVLAAALLAVLGVGLRARLLWILAAIALYVPVAGGGPSIQRAGVMGAAGVIAALADRPGSRWYALLLAAVATLGLDPRAASDIGWQLSFAAVLGILLLAAPLAESLTGAGGRWRRLVAQALALTISATIATAPLMALHFGTFSIVALPANLAALPAEAPVMWLGMLAAAAGQAPALPVEPLTWLAGICAGYIAQVARWFGEPAWAQSGLAISGPGALLTAYLVLGAAVALALRVLRRRRGLAGSRRAAGMLLVLLASGAAVVAAVAGGTGEPRPAGLRMTALDVGQGDAILLEPADGDPVLVDSGPAGGGVVDQLEARGVDRLAALVITHPESDHDGAAGEILEHLAVGRLVFARARPATVALARARGVPRTRIAAGARLRSGSLRLEALWPPAERVRAGLSGDPNLLALVLAVSWRGFDALLTGDAESETAPFDAGAGGVEVLKVAHHGSADAGLEALLRQVEPQLAMISVGAGNPYGHPAPSTLATLGGAGVAVARTDLEGPVTVAVAGDEWWLED